MRDTRVTVLLNRANKQFGVVRRADLAAAGIDRRSASRWVANGRLHRLYPGIYSVGHSALTPKGRWLAAQWSCGDDAVVSHTSATAYHGCHDEDADGPFHITTTGQARSREGIVVHRVRLLDPLDIFSPYPLLVTTIPRTVVDLADVLPWDEYRQAADKLPYLQLKKVKEAQDRAPGRRGAPLVTRLIEADDAHTRSEFERKYTRFSKTFSLPSPNARNAEVAGHQADVIYDRLIVELDGRAYHERRDQMRADRNRDTDYQLAGYRILRLVWDDLHPVEAARTADRVRKMLLFRNPSAVW